MDIFRNSHDILQTMPCGCVSFDEKGEIEFANDSLYQLLGYEEGQLTGHNIEKIFTISGRIFYQTQLYALIRLNGKADEVFISLKTKMGEVIPVMLYGKLKKTESGNKIIFLLLTVWERKNKSEIENSEKVSEDKQSLTRLKSEFELYQQKLDRQVAMLLQRNQEYVQLSKVLSHDLPEPIRKIGIFADMLMNHSEQVPDPVSMNKLQKIQSFVVRLQNLTSSLQQFVYIDNISESFSVLNLGNLIAEAKKDLIVSLGIEDFDITLSNIPEFEGRSTQIKVLFKELLQNAINNKSIGKPLKINITAHVTEHNSYQVNKSKYNYTDHIKLEITDNGSGFDNQYCSHIFGLFNKLNNKSSGAGLGLALCKQIVSYHYGTITANTNGNEGCTIRIILPVWQPV